MKFTELDRVDNLKEFIKDNFEVDLPVSGGWGYNIDEVTVVEEDSLPLKQIEHVFATVRANIEMHLMLPKDERYGGINLRELRRDTIDGLDVVDYEIEAIKEGIYAELISEYKEGYGKDSFDMDAHFKKREKATFRRVQRAYYKIITK